MILWLTFDTRDVRKQTGQRTVTSSGRGSRRKCPVRISSASSPTRRSTYSSLTLIMPEVTAISAWARAHCSAVGVNTAKVVSISLISFISLFRPYLARYDYPITPCNRVQPNQCEGGPDRGWRPGPPSREEGRSSPGDPADGPPHPA